MKMSDILTPELLHVVALRVGVIGGKWLRNAIATPIMGTCTAYVAQHLMRLKCHNLPHFRKIESQAMNYITLLCRYCSGWKIMSLITLPFSPYNICGEILFALI